VDEWVEIGQILVHSNLASADSREWVVEMNLFRSLILDGFLAILFTVVIPAPSAWSVEFVADQLTQIGDRTYRGSLFCKDDRWRIEHNSPGSVDVTIVRKDKGLMWLLSARLKQFQTLPVDQDAGLFFHPTLGNEIVREVIGAETLDGHPVTVSQITVREGEQNTVYYQWWANDLQLPLRVARRDGAWILQFKNVRLRSVSAQMFELPLNYRPTGP